jgi:hypothetical protein
MHYSNSCMAQASLSTGSRSHLLPAVVRLCGEFFMDGHQEKAIRVWREFMPYRYPTNDRSTASPRARSRVTRRRYFSSQLPISSSLGTWSGPSV